MKKPILIGLLLFIVLIVSLINVSRTKNKEQSNYKNDNISSKLNLNTTEKGKKDQRREYNYRREDPKKPFVNYIQTNTSTTAKKFPSRNLKGKIMYMSKSNNWTNWVNTFTLLNPKNRTTHETYNTPIYFSQLKFIADLTVNRNNCRGGVDHLFAVQYLEEFLK